MLNMTGSIAFAISALGAYVVPSTGHAASLVLDNLGTFIGGLCFLFGALLLIPQEDQQAAGTPAGAGSDARSGRG
jgi:hypothetical protein